MVFLPLQSNIIKTIENGSFSVFFCVVKCNMCIEYLQQKVHCRLLSETFFLKMCLYFLSATFLCLFYPSMEIVHPAGFILQTKEFFSFVEVK